MGVSAAFARTHRWYWCCGTSGTHVKGFIETNNAVSKKTRQPVTNHSELVAVFWHKKEAGRHFMRSWSKKNTHCFVSYFTLSSPVTPTTFALSNSASPIGKNALFLYPAGTSTRLVKGGGMIDDRCIWRVGFGTIASHARHAPWTSRRTHSRHVACSSWCMYVDLPA